MTLFEDPGIQLPIDLDCLPTSLLAPPHFDNAQHREFADSNFDLLQLLQSMTQEVPTRHDVCKRPTFTVSTGDFI